MYEQNLYVCIMYIYIVPFLLNQTTDKIIIVEFKMKYKKQSEWSRLVVIITLAIYGTCIGHMPCQKL